MTLGDKIYQLRKERGLSQEALAEQLGATRQAVSKWETNQGFPETEKLLRLSSILGVSTDFLLKDEQTARSAEAGYYVSREMAAGFVRRYSGGAGHVHGAGVLSGFEEGAIIVRLCVSPGADRGIPCPKAKIHRHRCALYHLVRIGRPGSGVHSPWRRSLERPPRADLSRMGSGPSGVCLCSRHDGVV